MIKKLYHGSANIIKQPIFGFGKPYNDYGLGFYCTEDIEMAKEWAVSKERNGYANAYEMDLNGLQILHLNDSSYNILHWLTILLEHREFDMPSVLALEAKEYLSSHFRLNLSAYDIITGYRADDSYFSFAQDFLNGTISYRQLNNALHLGNLGQQFVLKSKTAFERITYANSEIADHSLYYTRKMLRDRNARQEYFDVERMKRKPDDLYITQIIDERMMPNDPRL